MHAWLATWKDIYEVAAMEVVKEADANAEVVNDEQLSKLASSRCPPLSSLAMMRRPIGTSSYKRCVQLLQCVAKPWPRPLQLPLDRLVQLPLLRHQHRHHRLRQCLVVRSWSLSPKAEQVSPRSRRPNTSPQESYITISSTREVHWQVRGGGGGLPADHAQQES